MFDIYDRMIRAAKWMMVVCFTVAVLALIAECIWGFRPIIGPESLFMWLGFLGLNHWIAFKRVRDLTAALEMRRQLNTEGEK